MVNGVRQLGDALSTYWTKSVVVCLGFYLTVIIDLPFF